jgi:hypothetical protein
MSPIQSKPVSGAGCPSEVWLLIFEATIHTGNHNRWAGKGSVTVEIVYTFPNQNNAKCVLSHS